MALIPIPRRSHYDLRGKTALVTGGGRGIGSEIARKLAGRGARVAIVDRDFTPAKAVAAELPGALAFQADVTQWDQLEAAVAAIVDQLGGIDVLVANAGIAAPGTIETIDPAVFERIVEVNLLGVWRTVRIALPHLLRSQGYVLAIGSIYSAVQTPLNAPYAAAKAGVEAFANTLRTEVASRGLDVGVAYFSFVKTDLERKAFEHPSAAELRRRLGWPTSYSVSTDEVASGALRAIENRSRVVAAPWWVTPLLLGRGVIQPLLEWRISGLAAEPVRMANEEARPWLADAEA